MTTSPLSITTPSPEIFSTTSVATEGFGEYQGFAPKNFEGYRTTQKVHLLIQTLLLGAATIAIVVGAVILSAPLWAAPLALLPIAILSVRAFLNHKAQSSYFPPNLTEGLHPKDFQGKQVGEYIQDNGLGVVLNDAIESKQYKLDLIRNAQQSIFLSCYMGEETLDEALDLIKEKMQQNLSLKVFILTSDHFLTDENRKRIEALKALYPDRFHTVFNPEIYYSEHPSGGGRRLLSTNHIKLMTIDQGNYMVIGGCALRPFWTDVTGEEHLQKLEQTGFDFQNPLEAKGFRDMDFAFKSEDCGAGMTSFLEGAKLMLRYAHMQSPQYAQTLKQQFLELMRLPRAESQVSSIDENLQQVRGLGMKLYSTGPDHTTNSYLDALIDLIDNAQEKIVIAHMYFHPPQSLIDALVRAAQRGVNIKIVSNTTESEAPLAHKFSIPWRRKLGGNYSRLKEDKTSTCMNSTELTPPTTKK